MEVLGLVLVGIVAGIFGGLLGIGGGTIVVPALVYFFGMTQHKAQGTILGAFLLPVAVLGFLKYYRTGNADIRMAAFIAAGIFLGSWVGASLSLSMSEPTLKRVFGVFLLAVALKMFLSK